MTLKNSNLGKLHRCARFSSVAQLCRTLQPHASSEYIMQNAVLDEAQARIKIAGRNINNLRYADDTTLMAESEEELKWKRRAKKLA